MSTRQARVSPDHVRALNTVDLSFYGFRLFGRRIQGAAAQAVASNWHEYQQHLNQDASNFTPERLTAWSSAGNELFLNLLESLAIATGYKFDRNSLRTGSYSPISHAKIEFEQNALRQQLLELLAGDRTLGMALKSVPVNEVVLAAQQAWQQDLLVALREMRGGVAARDAG